VFIFISLCSFDFCLSNFSSFASLSKITSEFLFFYLIRFEPLLSTKLPVKITPRRCPSCLLWGRPLNLGFLRDVLCVQLRCSFLCARIRSVCFLSHFA
jgi:hypothetical protein